MLQQKFTQAQNPRVFLHATCYTTARSSSASASVHNYILHSLTSWLVLFIAASNAGRPSTQLSPILEIRALMSVLSTSLRPPSCSSIFDFMSFTLLISIFSSAFGGRGVQRGLPASKCSDTAWLGEPGGGQRRTSMRVFLIISSSTDFQRGPNKVVKLAGLSSPVIIRRRIGYLKGSSSQSDIDVRHDIQWMLTSSRFQTLRSQWGIPSPDELRVPGRRLSYWQHVSSNSEVSSYGCDLHVLAFQFCFL